MDEGLKWSKREGLGKAGGINSLLAETVLELTSDELGHVRDKVSSLSGISYLRVLHITHRMRAIFLRDLIKSIYTYI